MKKILSILLFSFTLGLSSCDKDEPVYSDTQVGRSDVTVFPILTIKGQRYIAIEAGGTFTDPGVIAKAGADDIEYQTSGTVNTAVPGVYTLTYSANNKDGFPGTAMRTVVVYKTDASAAANDLSGNYARSTNGSIATWTKIAPGVYTVFNPGGAPGTNVTLIALNPTGFVIDIPTQVANDGGVFRADNEVYTNSNPPKYSMTIINPGYGTALRTFTKV